MSSPYRFQAPTTWVPCWGLRAIYVTDTHVSGAAATTVIDGADDKSSPPTITLTMLDAFEAEVLSVLISGGHHVTRVDIASFQLIWCDRPGAT